jgi:hypothetical protein
VKVTVTVSGSAFAIDVISPAAAIAMNINKTLFPVVI